MVPMSTREAAGREAVSMERRRSRRVSVMADIDYQLEGVAVSKRISDISEGGVFIDTPVPAAVGTDFRLRFALDGVAIEAAGRVVYSQSYIGMGVEFTSIPTAGLDAIRAYVAHTSLEMQPA